MRTSAPLDGHRRPRVLHLTTVDLSLEKLLLPQLTAFRAAGYAVIGVSAPGPSVAAIERAGIRHVALPHSTRQNAPWRDLRAMFAFWRMCRRLRPDIVHTHNPKPGIYGRIAARLAGVPVVINTVHGLYALPDDPWLKRALVYSLERLASVFSDAELLQNVEDLPVLRRLRIPERKLHVLGNGIDLNRFDPDADPRARRALRDSVRDELGILDSEVLVGTVGRLVVEKGYLEVFAAARELRSRGLPVRFVVIGPHEPDKGDGLASELLKRVEQETGVIFLGMRDDVERLYPAMDIFVLASHREGFPRAAMEAAAMGLPVVATDVRGCRQVVEDEVNGLLVPVRDPAGLAEALAALVADEPRRVAMGAAAQAKAREEFDDRTQVSITLALYERLLVERR